MFNLNGYDIDIEWDVKNPVSSLFQSNVTADSVFAVDDRHG